MKNLKKTFTKLVVMTLAFVFVVSVFGGCSKPKKNYNDPNTVFISAWDSGFGLGWLEQIADKYEENNPGITIDIESTTLRDKATLPLTSESYYDIVMADSVGLMTASQHSRFAGFETDYTEITDVYDSCAPGESKTIRSKLTDLTAEFIDVNGKNFYMPMQSTVWGLSYNVDVLSNYYIPKTSYEMELLCDQLKKDTSINAPIIFTGDTDYWDPILWTWWAQYEGKDSYDAFFRGQTTDGKYTPDIFSAIGRLRALEQVETFLTPTNGYCDSNSTGYQYMQGQLYYLQGKYAFMANGGWLENEMAASFKGSQMANIDFMDVPVISSIVERLSFYEEGEEVAFSTLDATKKAAYDAKLKAIIDYVDGESTSKPEGVIDDDVAIVEEARSLYFLTEMYYHAAIPCYSKRIDHAKNFLRYLYSDEAAKIYAKADIGSLLPIKHDFLSSEEISQISPLKQTLLEKLNTKQIIMYSYNDPIVYQGGLTDFAISGTLEANFGSVNPIDRVSAYNVFMYDYNYYRQGNAWDNLMQAAGVA